MKKRILATMLQAGFGSVAHTLLTVTLMLYTHDTTYSCSTSVALAIDVNTMPGAYDNTCKNVGERISKGKFNNNNFQSSQLYRKVNT